MTIYLLTIKPHEEITGAHTRKKAKIILELVTEL